MFAAITEPSALLSNARSTITALIQRPSSITTSNAFDEFSILDRLIDVSKDVERLEDGETRKFVNIAQVITASTCIYSRRVDALYKLINNFTDNPIEDKSSSEESEQSTPTIAIEDADDNSKKTKKTKPIDQQTCKEKSSKRRRSFISLDPDKLNYNTNKGFFLDRTSIVEIKLFQNYVPMGNKQFWFDDSRPVIFDLLFDEPIRNLPEIQEEIVHVNEPERLIDVVNQVPSMDQEIPLPDRDYFDDDRENIYPPAEVMVPERKKVPINAKNRTKKIKPNEMDRNIFRRSLTDEEQGLFVCHKMKPLTANKTQGNETKDFFLKKFQRKHFEALIKGNLLSHPLVWCISCVSLLRLSIIDSSSVHLSDHHGSVSNDTGTIFCQIRSTSSSASSSFTCSASKRSDRSRSFSPTLRFFTYESFGRGGCRSTSS